MTASSSKLKAEAAIAREGAGSSPWVGTEGEARHAPHATTEEGLENLVGVHI